MHGDRLGGVLGLRAVWLGCRLEPGDHVSGFRGLVVEVVIVDGSRRAARVVRVVEEIPERRRLRTTAHKRQPYVIAPTAPRSGTAERCLRMFRKCGVRVRRGR